MTTDRSVASLPQALQITQWLFFDANELHNGIGISRNHLAFKVPGDAAPALARAKMALATLEARLSGGRSWLELGRPTLAEVACAPLIFVSSEATLALERYPPVAG